MIEYVVLDTDVGALLYPAHDGGVTIPVQIKGSWEPEEGAVIKEKLFEGSYFVDVGAHVGYFSVMASKIVGRNGYVQAFEPNPLIFPLLERNLLGCEQCEAYQQAAESATGVLEFWPSKVNSGDTRGYRHNEAGSPFLALCNRLDIFCRSVPDLVKIDTQGSDQNVVEGMLKWIMEGTFPPTIVEWWPEGMAAGGGHAPSVMDYYQNTLGLKVTPIGTNTPVCDLPYADGYCSLLLEQ